jgi:hypothetical protein
MLFDKVLYDITQGVVFGHYLLDVESEAEPV